MAPDEIVDAHDGDPMGGGRELSLALLFEQLVYLCIGELSAQEGLGLVYLALVRHEVIEGKLAGDAAELVEDVWRPNEGADGVEGLQAVSLALDLSQSVDDVVQGVVSPVGKLVLHGIDTSL